jgi:hypothetical protein
MEGLMKDVRQVSRGFVWLFVMQTNLRVHGEVELKHWNHLHKVKILLKYSSFQLVAQNFLVETL